MRISWAIIFDEKEKKIKVNASMSKPFLFKIVEREKSVITRADRLIISATDR
jgi:hypothetical protein